MQTKFTFLFLISILISACTGTQTMPTQSENFIPTEIVIPQLTATPLPFPTFTPTNTVVYISPEPAGFPFAAQLNEALPKENLLLAIHEYSDMVGHLADEICFDLGIYSDDSYIAISCLPNYSYPVPNGKLNEYQSKFVYRWVEQFQAFEEPSMNGLIQFAGTGNVFPDYADKVSMRALVGDLEWDANAYVHQGGYPPAVFYAREVLSNRINMWLDDSSILNFEVVNFSDSCLGAPEPNEICEPIIIEGFRIYLVANGLMYEYHTDAFGYDIRSVGEPQTAPTQGAGG